MGGQRVNLDELRKIIPDPYGQAAGLVPVVTQYTDERGLTQYIYTLQAVAPGSAQTKIQFQYNGSSLGATGTVDTFDVASSWATFARAGNTVTLTVPTPVQSLNSLVGALSITSLDGSVTILASGSTVDLSTSGGSLIRARVATAAALPANTYSNGASGVGATLTGLSVGALTIDGVAVALSDVVLVQSEVTQSHNGVYVVTTLGTVGVAYVLTRDPRMNQSGEFTGALVTTGPDGTANKDMTFECTAVSPVTVGTTAITFQSVGGGVTSPLTTKGDIWGYSTVNARIPVGADGSVLRGDSSQALGVKWDTNLPKRGPGCIFTNGGLLLTGTLASEVEVPYGFSGTGWTIVGDVAGSASIVVSHSTYSAYDTMVTLFTATVSSDKKNQATGLSFSLAAGDILRFSASGFAGFTRCSIVLDGTAT